MKYIFLVKNEQKKNIKEVYSGKAIKKMNSLEIKVDHVYTESDIGVKDFSYVKYIFSTWNMPFLSKEQIIHYFPSLEAVFYAAGNVRYFAKPFIDLGIKVFSADSANGKAVADFASSQIILATKGYYQSQYYYSHRQFKKAKKIASDHIGTYCANIGIIGVGKVGRAVIENLSKYDLNMYICDPMVDDVESKKMGSKKTDLVGIFTKCDVISNHLPNIISTRNILNYNLFRLMKDNSTFINTGRGEQVVENDLVKALKKNKTLSAVLDVTCREPLMPTSRLFCLKNVFITPHIAGSLNVEKQRMAEYMLNAYENYIKGKELQYLVLPEMLDRMI